jgi:hypothetical protein
MGNSLPADVICGSLIAVWELLDRQTDRFLMLKTPRSSAYLAIGLLAAQLIGLLAVVFVTLPLISRWHALDLTIYYQDSLQLVAGQLPYRDFALEYPPLALLPFVLPRLAAFGQRIDFSGYAWLFLIQSAILSTLIALVIVRLRPRPKELAIYALLVAVSAPLLPWRYDLFPALLTALALLCLLRERPGWAGIWLGFGVAAKLYPIVLLPIFAAYYLAGKNWPALARLALGSAGAVAATLLPFVLIAPGPLLSFLRYHQLRGLQLESLPAGAIALAHVLGLTRRGSNSTMARCTWSRRWPAPRCNGSRWRLPRSCLPCWRAAWRASARSRRPMLAYRTKA